MDVTGSNYIRCAAEKTMSAGRALMLEALSHRMLRHCDVEVWRQLFLGPAYATIRFEVVQLTLLSTDAPLDDFSAEEAAMLAQQLGGTVEPSAQVDLILGFSEPAAALRAAMLLQRLSAHRRVRTALGTHLCTVACYDVGGDTRRLVVGAEIELAEAAVPRAAPGTIVIAAETYALLGDRITEQMPDGLLATELEDDRVRQASITLAPHASAPQSTFAGLGLI